MTNDASWQELYAAAMLELDRAKLKVKIDLAQAAIREARERLTSDGNAGGGEDWQALTAALGNLQSLERVEFRRTVPADNPNVTSA